MRKKVVKRKMNKMMVKRMMMINMRILAKKKK